MCRELGEAGVAALRVSDTEVAALKLEAWADVESLLRHENTGPGGEGAARRFTPHTLPYIEALDAAICAV